MHLFFFQCYGDHRDLHSFPTRRSSDLALTQSGVSVLIAARGFRSTDYVELLLGLVPELTATGTGPIQADRKSTRLNSSHSQISYAVFCLKKKKHHKLPHITSPTYRPLP